MINQLFLFSEWYVNAQFWYAIEVICAFVQVTNNDNDSLLRSVGTFNVSKLMINLFPLTIVLTLVHCFVATYSYTSWGPATHTLSDQFLPYTLAIWSIIYFQRLKSIQPLLFPVNTIPWVNEFLQSFVVAQELLFINVSISLLIFETSEFCEVTNFLFICNW